MGEKIVFYLSVDLNLTITVENSDLMYIYIYGIIIYTHFFNFSSN